jgi:hypothetical protein
METIKVDISEWHLAMLESMEKTTGHTRRSLLEGEIVKMHSALLNRIKEGQKLQSEGNAYLEKYKEYNIDNWKGL